MTIVLDTDLRLHEDTPVLNILTVAAVNVACFAGLTVGAQAAGLGWGWSLLVGWLGGGAATIAIITALTIILPVASQRLAKRHRVQDAQSDTWQTTLDAWRTDLRTENDLVALWDRDAEQDRRAAAAQAATAKAA